MSALTNNNDHICVSRTSKIDIKDHQPISTISVEDLDLVAGGKPDFKFEFFAQGGTKGAEAGIKFTVSF